MIIDYLIDGKIYDISFDGLYSLIRLKHQDLFGYQISDEFSYNPIKYLKQRGVSFNNENDDLVKSQINEIVNDFKEYTNVLFLLNEAKLRINNITQKYIGEALSKMLIEQITREVLIVIQKTEDEYGICLRRFDPVPKITENNGALMISLNLIEK